MITFRRDLLLLEIERRCADAQCNAKTRIGLTKDEARAYRGFECERCERWHEDVLSERDVPEWWEELTLTGLDGLRPQPSSVEPGEVVTRMSDAWRDVQEQTPSVEDADGG